jgi:hypothetical protein
LGGGTQTSSTAAEAEVDESAVVDEEEDGVEESGNDGENLEDVDVEEDDEDAANVRLLAGDDAMAIISRAPRVNIMLLLLSYIVDMQRRRRVGCCCHVEDKVELVLAVAIIITLLLLIIVVSSNSLPLYTNPMVVVQRGLTRGPLCSSKQL